MTEEQVMLLTGKQSPAAFALWTKIRRAWVGPGRKLRRHDILAWRTYLDMFPSDRESLALDVRRYLSVIQQPGMRKYRMQLARFIMDPSARSPDAWWRKHAQADDHLPEL